jgi:O-acetyl-ADP-ribose deacetylase
MVVVVGRTQLELLQGDIADQDTDAVVTAAHWDLRGGQGTDGSIHWKAGPLLLEECRTIGFCPTGGAVITRGYCLKARHVIHTVGPVWEKGRANEAENLASAYEHSLALAIKHGLESISFPSLSTGAFGYPMRLAAPVAMRTIVGFLRRRVALDLVRFVLYPRESRTSYTLYSSVLAMEIQAYETHIGAG